MKVLLFLLLFPAMAIATDITVTGFGTTSDEAIQSALRLAVESAAGVYVHSTTEVADSALISDKIITASKSLVSSYSVVSQKIDDGVVMVTLSVDVSPQVVSAIIRSSGGVSVDDSIKDFHLITNRVMQLRRAAELLDTFKTMPVSSMYIASYLGYEVVKVGLDGATIRLKYSIARNPFFWDAYYQVLNHIKEEGGLFSTPKDASELCLGYKCRDSVYVNDGLVYKHAVDIQEIKVKLTVIDFSVVSSEHRLYDSNNIVKECQIDGDCKQLLDAYHNTYKHYPWPLYRYMTYNYPPVIDKISAEGFSGSIDTTISDLELIKVLPKMKARVVAH